MNDELWNIFHKDAGDFSPADIETIMRSNLFKEGGMVNRGYRITEKSVTGETEEEIKRPSLDTNGFGKLIGVSGRTIHECITATREITPRTYNAIMSHVEIRLLRLKVAEYERRLSIQK